MTPDLPTTLTRLRLKAERASMLPRDSFKPAFIEAMGLIEELLTTQEALRQAVFDGGVRAGELTAKVIDRERRLRACAKWVHGDQTQENYWRACGATNMTVPFKEEP